MTYAVVTAGIPLLLSRRQVNESKEERRGKKRETQRKDEAGSGERKSQCTMGAHTCYLSVLKTKAGGLL